MDTVYYCGFNGFKQVPTCNGHTLNTLVLQQPPKKSKILDVAICWNYLVVLDENGLTKYGLVHGKNGQDRLSPPKEDRKIVKVSATPRHLLACTDNGECWTHEEAKGWRKVQVGTEVQGAEDKSDVKSDLIDLSNPESPTKACADTEPNLNPVVTKKSPYLVKTACGDAHNIGLDSLGVAYSLPSPLDFRPFPSDSRHKVVDIACGKEHCLLLTEHGQVYTWGGGSRGQLGHGSLMSEEHPRLVSALDGLRIKKIAAGGWHSAAISQFDDLYMFGWNESGQLAQTTNLVKPAECFAAVEKLLMACCTMQPEDASNPRGDSEDCEVYLKNDGESPKDLKQEDLEKDALTCYNAATSCNDTPSDLIVVQNIPMLVPIPNEAKAIDVACGSRHTIVLTGGNQLYGFGWNKYGQLGLGHTVTKDAMEKISLPKSVGKNSLVKFLRGGDWGTVLVVSNERK